MNPDGTELLASLDVAVESTLFLVSTFIVRNFLFALLFFEMWCMTVFRLAFALEVSLYRIGIEKTCRNQYICYVDSLDERTLCTGPARTESRGSRTKSQILCVSLAGLDFEVYLAK